MVDLLILSRGNPARCYEFIDGHSETCNISYKALKDKFLNLPIIDGLDGGFIHDDIYEIDKTHIHAAKNPQGGVLEGLKFWVAGVFCRETKAIYPGITRL